MNRVLLVGKPNSGKTLLFNRLTGLAQKVANFPGVTVDITTGQCDTYEIVDFPGTYSLSALTKDEQIALDQLKENLGTDRNSLVLCNLDATRLERSLVFGLQIQRLAKQHEKPVVYCLNMMDEIERNKISFDTEKLKKLLGSPVVPISAKTTKGLDRLKETVQATFQNPAAAIPGTVIAKDEQSVLRAREVAEQVGIAQKKDIILKNQNALDRFFIGNISGGIAFFVIMALLFQSIFTWATPLMDGVESAVGALAVFVASFMGEGIAKDFVVDAIFGGFGSFLVFVPQIMVLTFVIGILEDSGYLARAAIICHRPLSYFGLSGESFVPYLSGFACAIPAMLASRTIHSPRKRLITLLTIPLMACSARLPVYALLTAALIPNALFAGGLVSLRGLVFFGLYLFGLVLALLASALLSRFTSQKLSDTPFIIELPPYRLPHWKPLLLKTASSAKLFVTRAGWVIFTVSVVIWVMGYFPDGNGALESSWLASIGRWINPVFEPLGVDWRYGTAILLSFLAREVFVGTLGTLFGIEGADENVADLATKIQNDGLSMASGAALLVFYAVALQCVSTLAMMKKETGSNVLPVIVFVAYTIVAYGLACVVRLLFSI